jgi:hypothetical protein
MGYTRNKIEMIILGTMLNDMGGDNFMQSCRLSLRKELFADKKNAFVFMLLDNMYQDGIKSTTPSDVFKYANDKNIRYGNTGNFLNYLYGLATDYYAFNNFRNYVKQLVELYIKETKYGTV